MKFNELGRSMVEMLGVLAIIGVLSVGAISGYSKAMMKYKLNKQASQISNLLNNAISTSGQFSPPTYNGSPTSYSLIPFYIKLGFIDEEMIKDDTEEKSQVYDVFGNTITSGFQTVSAYTQMWTQITFTAPNDSQLIFDQCLNMLSLAKELKENLWQVWIYGFDSDAVESNQRLYGDSYCNKNTTCLKSLTMEQTYTFCRSCAYEKKTNRCQLSFHYNYHQ